MLIVGIDGTPKGWCAVFRKEHQYFTEHHTSLSTLFETHPLLKIIAIDMVIGLPQSAQKGGRWADKHARTLLSPRGSVVFSAPCRAAVYAQDYAQANQRSRASAPDNIGLSKQSYNICPKIRELDNHLLQDTALRKKCFEVHPELSFWEMNQQMPLPSKHKPEGKTKRIALLESNGIPCTSLLTHSKYHIDLIDAAACLWSAQRIVNQTSRKTPSPMQSDQKGLPMCIHW